METRPRWYGNEIMGMGFCGYGNETEVVYMGMRFCGMGMRRSWNWNGNMRYGNGTDLELSWRAGATLATPHVVQQSSVHLRHLTVHPQRVGLCVCSVCVRVCVCMKGRVCVRECA